MRSRLLLAFLCAIAPMFPACTRADETAGTVQAGDKKINVYYFHRNIRCPSCEQIEALTKQAVEQGFAEALANGSMAWQVVNIEKPENAHFEKDYKLETQSVVVSEVQNGKEVRWKNLDKVWDLLGNEADFVQYIAREIKAFTLEASASGVKAARETPDEPAEQTTQESAQQALPKLVDLGAGKCIPCKKMAPILEELKKEYEGKLEVVFIDVWQNRDEAKKYNINLIPTQIFFDASGKEQFRHEGFFSKEDILGKWKELGVDLAGPTAGK